jgi:multidrug efflux pump subunit AcrA (membrane-fusion protein)
MAMRFRKEALEQSNTQEALDLPVRLTRPHSWIGLVVLAAVVIWGVGWAFAGSLPRTISAQGLLTSAQGSFRVQSVAAGQVLEVKIKLGALVQQGTSVAVVSDGRQTTVVRAPARGRIFSLAVRVGQVISAGATVATAERAGTPADNLVAILYLSNAEVATVHPGDAVELTVESVPVTPFGVLHGRVASIDPFVSRRSDVSDFLGDDDLAEAITAGGPARKVVVDLQGSALTASGYAWSTRAGPPFALGSRAAVAGAVAQPPVRPIDWIMPK